MTRVWPWRHKHTDLPPVEDGRGEAWAGFNDAQAQLAAVRRQGDRVRRVRAALLAEGARNHFGEAIEHAMKERRAS